MLDALRPYFLIIKIIFVAALFVAGIALGMHIDNGKIATLNQTIGSLQTANNQMSAAVVQQNAAIDALKKDAQDRAEAAQKAIEAAKSSAMSKDKQAQAIMQEKAPKGSNECDAARQAFDDELRSERK